MPAHGSVKFRYPGRFSTGRNISDFCANALTLGDGECHGVSDFIGTEYDRALKTVDRFF